MGNSHFPLSRPLLPIRRGTKTNKIPDIAKNGNKITTLLPRVSILFLRRKRRTLPKSSTIPTIRKGITPTSILEIRSRSQKTSVSLGDFHASDWDEERDDWDWRGRRRLRLPRLWKLPKLLRMRELVKMAKRAKVGTWKTLHEFRASASPPTLEKNICWHSLTWVARSMWSTKPLLRN